MDRRTASLTNRYQLSSDTRELRDEDEATLREQESDGSDRTFHESQTAASTVETAYSCDTPPRTRCRSAAQREEHLMAFPSAGTEQVVPQTELIQNIFANYACAGMHEASQRAERKGSTMKGWKEKNIISKSSWNAKREWNRPDVRRLHS